MKEENIIVIRREDITAADTAFSYLMRKTEALLNDNARRNVDEYKRLSPKGLESVSLNAIRECCADTPFRAEQVNLVSGQRFPDIVAEKYYGVEVKSTNKNHWTSTGSSIVESTRDKDVENIYMLFGKLGGTPAEFKCRPYQDVLYEIAVTHSPRYLIDMNLKKGHTIFDKMGKSYDELRTSEHPIEEVKHYYEGIARRQGRQLPWWISDDGDDAQAVSMNIRLWGSIGIEEKKILRAQMLILFPEVIKSQYNRAALWLAGAKGIVCNAIRDPFSSGGRIMEINGIYIGEKQSRIVKTLSDSGSSIRDILSHAEDLIDYIKAYNPDLLSGDMYTKWVEQANKALHDRKIEMRVEDIFCASLK